MIYLHTYVIHGSKTVHYFYAAIVDIYYSVAINTQFNTMYYCIGHINMYGETGFFVTSQFDYTLPDSLYILDDLLDNAKNLENSKLRIILNSL